jgi:hypothetical protein
MLLWIAGSIGWQVWQARASAAAAPPVAAPVVKARVGEELAQWYIGSADGILEAYRTSPHPWLYEFDWQKAEICLERAVQLGAGDDRTIAKLALARGYATLERLSGGQYSDRAAAGLRVKARDEFLRAALRAPADPAPHLALARVYVYSMPDPEKAMAEFASAQQQGATLGSREVEQQGDVYRIRAQQELASDWRQAKRDADVARGFYARIPGFDEVDGHVRDLARIHAPAPKKTRARKMYGWW